MLAHSAHLILAGFQIVEHLGIVVELGIYGQRLHRHTHGVQETFVGTAVVNGCEQRLLFIVIFSQKEAIDRRKEIALENAIFLAECIYFGHIHVKCPHHTGLCVFRLF